MKKIFLVAAVAAVTVIGSGAGAAELPSFELKAFPITRHQVAVMGAQGVQEQSATRRDAGVAAPDRRPDAAAQHDGEGNGREADHCWSRG